jgi:hypothetical protein
VAVPGEVPGPVGVEEVVVVGAEVVVVGAEVVVVGADVEDSEVVVVGDELVEVDVEVEVEVVEVDVVDVAVEVVAVVVLGEVVVLAEEPSVAAATPAPPRSRPAVTIVATIVRSASARTGPPFVSPGAGRAHGPIGPSVTDRDSTAGPWPHGSAPFRTSPGTVHPLRRAPSRHVISS